MKNIKLKVQGRNIEGMPLQLGLDGENLQYKLIFTFNKFIDGTARLEYMCGDGSSAYIILDKEDETYSTILKNILMVKGTLKLQLVITQGTDEEEIPIYKSMIFSTDIAKSINAETEEPSEYSTWIEIANTKLNTINELENTIETNETTREEYIKELKEEVENGDLNGTTFTPNVDEEGNISWTNDKGRENPETKNIRGPQGEKGNPGSITLVLVGDTLPETGEEGKIYLRNITPKEKEEHPDDDYTEWIWIAEKEKFEAFGGTSVEVDMSNYYTKTETDTIKTTIEGEIPTKVSQLSNDSNYVKNTDWASSSTGGVTKVGNGFYLDSVGVPYSNTYDYTTYSSKNKGTFISKGTLDNVLDNVVGDIESALNEILEGDK